MAQIRANFAQLIAAFRAHDAHTVCELLFPFGQHQPASALGTDLNRLRTAAGQTRYQRYVDHCAPVLAGHPRDFEDFQRIFNGITLGDITIRGNVATVRARAPERRSFQMRFVRAAGEWRLLDGVQ